MMTNTDSIIDNHGWMVTGSTLIHDQNNINISRNNPFKTISDKANKLGIYCKKIISDIIIAIYYGSL
jgi:hypothetical protein